MPESKPEAKEFKIKSHAFPIAITIMSAVMVVICMVFFTPFPAYFRLACYAVVSGLYVVGIIFYFTDKRAPFRLCFLFMILLLAVLAVYIVLDLTGVSERLTNIEALKAFILSTGIWGRLVFILLVILEVVVLPIPSIILCLTGTALFGPLQAFLLVTTGNVIGSLIAFSLGRVFGKKLVAWIVGKEEVNKYRRLLSNKGKFLLIIMFLFPLFPDDMLCMIAGLTTMSYGFFITAVLLTRPITVAANCFLGSGALIPFRGWGIAVWIIIFAVLGTAFFLLNKFQKPILKKLEKIFKRKTV